MTAQLLPASTNWLVIPPDELQIRTVGGVYQDYLSSGLETVENLRDVLARDGKSFADFRDTLDFGCGAARTARFIHPSGYEGKLTGADVDRDAINYCNGWMGKTIDFALIPFDPPMPFDAGRFDLIYSISTFTHFREDYQHHWLKELHRVAAPDATLILTIAGKKNLDYVSADQRETLDSEGFLYAEGVARGDHNPDYYHLALHTHDYVRRVWGEYFEIIDIVPEIINSNQHAVLCRKR